MAAMFCAPSKHNAHSDDEDVFYNDAPAAMAVAAGSSSPEQRRAAAASIDQLAEKEFTEARVMTDITTSRVINDSLVKSHVEYKVVVTIMHAELNVRLSSWTVWRRYSDFRDLDNSLRASLPPTDVESMLPLPSTGFFRSVSDDHVEKKRQSLKMYLQRLVSLRAACSNSSLSSFLAGSLFELAGHYYSAFNKVLNQQIKLGEEFESLKFGMEARIAALQKENELLKTQLQQSETQRQSAVVQLQKYRRQFADDGTLALDSLSDPSSGAASGVNGASGSAGPNSPAANNLANIGMQMAKLTRVGSNSLLSSSPRFSAIGAPQSPSFGSASSTSASSSSASGGIGARLSANPPRLASGSPTAEQTQSAAASPTSASSSSDSASDSSSSTALQTLSSSSTSSADASSSEKSSDDKAASAAAVKQRGESVDKSSNTEESASALDKLQEQLAAMSKDLERIRVERDDAIQLAKRYLAEKKILIKEVKAQRQEQSTNAAEIVSAFQSVLSVSPAANSAHSAAASSNSRSSITSSSSPASSSSSAPSASPDIIAEVAAAADAPSPSDQPPSAVAAAAAPFMSSAPMVAASSVRVMPTGNNAKRK